MSSFIATSLSVLTRWDMEALESQLIYTHRLPKLRLQCGVPEKKSNGITTSQWVVLYKTDQLREITIVEDDSFSSSEIKIRGTKPVAFLLFTKRKTKKNGRGTEIKTNQSWRVKMSLFFYNILKYSNSLSLYNG